MMESLAERLREIFADKTNRMFVFTFVVFVFVLFAWGLVSMYKRDSQAADFFKREIHGVLINIEDITHGEYTLTIQQNGTNEILEYYLYISKFVRDNNIQKLDSISKLANGHTINFYKKKEGRYYKCCELYYE